MKETYERKYKADKPVLAICYDFDKTLSPDDMQAQGYIQPVGYDVNDFWTETNELAENNDMDQNLAYMYKMIEKSKGKFVFNKTTLEEYGSKVHLFPGVEDWFERIKKYGEKHGVIVEHYIISCGLKEMIDGTSVAKNGAFEKIYASSFYYDDFGVAKWPSQVVNYTNKTQFLFRISKGVLNVNDQGVNDSFSPEEIRVPFRNMVYIGDSDTDIPCMKLINSYGGHSIAVYNAETEDKSKVYKMMREGRIRYYTPADYSDGAKLDKLIKAIIDRTAANEALENIYVECKNENQAADMQRSDEEKKKSDLIMALENSATFATTHMMIKQLQEYDDWSSEDKEILFKIALKNSQVSCILSDKDVNRFYNKLINGLKTPSANAEKIKQMLKK
ncbi:MAG: haloacid dehalogenase-like hydrolase [Clostridia bacterium]|nr:haloacid dehalogenase-like hydrolase [Clostridia bacterium]